MKQIEENSGESTKALEQIKKTNEEETTKLRDLLKTCDSKIGELETKVMNLNGEIKTLKQELETKSLELISATRSVDEQKAIYSKMKLDFENQIAKCNQDYQTLDDEYKALKLKETDLTL